MKSFLSHFRQLDRQAVAKRQPKLADEIDRQKLNANLMMTQAKKWNQTIYALLASGSIWSIVFWLLTAPAVAGPTCSAAGGTVGSNLFINNGSFGTGSNTPGTTGAPLPAGRTTYTPATYGGNAPQDGQYSIVNQLNQTTFNYWFNPVYGHTTGAVNDQMMVINAAFTPGTFYTETLTVPANQTIEFGVWVLNLPNPNLPAWASYAGGTVGNPNASGSNIKPNISLVVNRVGVDDNNNGVIDEPGEGQVIATTGDIPFTSSPTWAYYGSLISTGNATTIEYRLVNNAPGGTGNDLAIDDVLVTTCTLPSGNITGTLYRDQNTNNAYNSGTDLTLPANIAVDLKNSTGGLVATAYTNASGGYSFTNVPAGSNYTIQVALTDSDIPSGATATANPSGTNTTGIQTGITVTAGATLANQNFGFSPILSISGTVFEDPNYGGGAGRPLSTAGTSPRDGATVELYNSAGNYVTSTATTSGGKYSFSGMAAGNYFVRVVNSTVTSSRPGSVNTLTPVQTFRTIASSGNPVNDPNRVGGEKPAVADTGAAAAGAKLNTSNFSFATAGGNATNGGQAESVSPVTVSTSPLSSIDFGYNFDTIVNTNNSGQGSLRQFINNSNALTNTGLAQVGQTAGKEVSIFMIPDGNAHPGLQAGLTSQLAGGVAIIQPTSALPAITDTDTIINGATQTSNIGNSNSGSYGFVGAVGTGLDGRENTGDEPSLNGINKPEVAIKGANNIPIGLDLVGNNETVQNMAIYGFGQGTGPYAADVVARGTGITIDHNAIGTTADTLADPGAGVRSGGSHIYLATNSNSTIANNLIVFAFQRGIFSSEESTLTVNIQGNEIRANNGEGSYAGGGIEFTSFAGVFGGPSNGTISPQGSIVGNYIADNDPNQLGGKDNGIEFGGNTGATVLVKDNTITGNSSGISLYSLKYPVPHTNSITIQNNVLKNNYDSGVNISNNQGITITQNSIYNNIGLGIQLGAGANDGAYNTTSSSGSSANIPGNQAIDYPVITSSKLVAGTLTVKGFVGNVTTGSSTFGNTKLEFFIADNTLADQNGEVILGDGKSKPHGEGRTYIGNCNADANGMFTCSFANASTVGLTDPKNITATTTNGAGYTSQFSATPPAGAKLMLVKRITAINGITTGFKTFVDNPDTTNDNNCNWPTATGTAGACTNTYTLGAINGGTVKPGDEIEYTIYYLNAGDSDATPARVCDALNPKLTFSPQGGNGIGLSQAGGAISALTNATDSDKGQLTTPALATNCNFKDNNSSTEVVAVDVAPVSGAISGATPNTSYGLIRFKTTVK
jgi:SdrD B-like domain/Right handed beta helix region